MTVPPIETALAVHGVAVRVEVRGGLAILIPRDGATIATEAQRRAIVALATAHGFTHVALELVD